MLAEKVHHVDQLVGCGGPLCCCVASHCQSHHQIDSTVLSFPVLSWILAILLQHAANIAYEQLGHLQLKPLFSSSGVSID